MEADIVADPTFAPNVIASHEDGACSDFCLRADNAMRSDIGGTVNLCRWIDDGARMDAFGMFLRWEKEWQHSRHGYTRIRYTNDDFFRRSKIVTNQYRRGRTLLCRGKVGLFLGKREIASLGVIGRREAGQLDRTVAEDFSAEVLRDLVRRKGNKGMGKCHKLLRRRKIPFPLESEIVGPLSTYRSHRMANIPSLPGELPFPLGLLAFGSGVMLTAPNLAPKDSELVRREIQEIREALEAFNAAVETGEMTGFKDDGLRAHGS